MIDAFTGRFEFLSNFFVDANGFCAEVEFQALKSTCHQDYDYVRGAYSFSIAKIPREAKRRGRKIKLRDDWDEIKLEVMRGIIETKFSPLVMRNLLLSTGHHKLVEGNWWHDIYWGVCNGSMRVSRCPGHEPQGKNHLGLILMEVREKLRNG